MSPSVKRSGPPVWTPTNTVSRAEMPAEGVALQGASRESHAAQTPILGPVAPSFSAKDSLPAPSGRAPAGSSPLHTRLTQVQAAKPEPGRTLDGVAFLRAIAKVRGGGELTPAAEAKLEEIQKKLGLLATELEGAKNPAEKAQVIARAFANIGAPSPEGYLTAGAGQQAAVGSAMALLAGLSTRVALSIHSLPQVAALAAGTLVGGVAANKISAVLHHALDNYSFESNPVLGKMAQDFQDHHVDPMAVTKESWALTAYSSAVPVIGVVGAVLALNPWIAVDAVVGTIGLLAMMGQTGHKMSHRPNAQVPLVYDVAQLLGLSITREDHATHHVSPHSHHYAMISGNPTEDGPGFRRWEALIYRLTGVEPNSWKLEPKLRVEALGPLGYDARAVQAVALRDEELADLKAKKRDQNARLQAGESLGEGEALITTEDIRRKAEEVPDRNRVPPEDYEGATTPFILNLRQIFSRP